MSSRFPALLLAALVVVSPVVHAAEPPNLNAAKQAVQKYVASGEYGRDVAAVALKANKYIAKRVARAQPGEKLAIIFDIDETTLSNLAHIQDYDYGYNEKVWHEWVASARATAILPVQTIYENAIRQNVAVFFVTARTESQRPGTEKNLREVGYDRLAGIFFKRDTSEDPSRLYKTGVRIQIESQGYIIIANVGDQKSDLAGGHAERTFKLPNPFYIVN
jgi:predicted secreted acid phosphatase